MGAIKVAQSTTPLPQIIRHWSIDDIISDCFIFPSFLYLKKYIDWAESKPIIIIAPQKPAINASISIDPYCSGLKIRV